jgi:hypothetical protein
MGSVASGRIGLRVFERQEGDYCVAHSINNLLGNTGTMEAKMSRLRVGCHPGTLTTPNLQSLDARLHPMRKQQVGYFHFDSMLNALAHFGLWGGRLSPSSNAHESIRRYTEVWDKAAGKFGPLIGYIAATKTHAVAITGPDFTGSQFDALGYIDSDQPAGSMMSVPAVAAMPASQLLPVVSVWAIHFDPKRATAATGVPYSPRSLSLSSVEAAQPEVPRSFQEAFFAAIAPASSSSSSTVIAAPVPRRMHLAPPARSRSRSRDVPAAATRREVFGPYRLPEPSGDFSAASGRNWSQYRDAVIQDLANWELYLKDGEEVPNAQRKTLQDAHRHFLEYWVNR